MELVSSSHLKAVAHHLPSLCIPFFGGGKQNNQSPISFTPLLALFSAETNSLVPRTSKTEATRFLIAFYKNCFGFAPSAFWQCIMDTFTSVTSPVVLSFATPLFHGHV
jgi:hypothetical protein